MLPDYITLEHPKLGTNCHTIITLSASGPRHCCLIGTWHCITLLLQSKAPIVTTSPLHCILDLNYSMRILTLPSCISQLPPSYIKRPRFILLSSFFFLGLISLEVLLQLVLICEVALRYPGCFLHWVAFP